MGYLTLRKPNGSELALVTPDGLRGISRAEQKQELLSTDTLSITVDSTIPLDISINDTLPVFGQLYTLNKLPTVSRDGRNRYRYDCEFEGPQYHLLRIVYFDTDTTGNALSSSFSLTGNLALFAQVLFTNMARVFSGSWGMGDVMYRTISGNVAPASESETKTLTFESENCLQVLQRLCTEYNTEFFIEYRPLEAPNRILHIAPAGTVKSDTFRYGQGNGLYNLTRQSSQQQDFYTRVYVFGGEKNLPSDYRGGFATRLQLPVPAGSPPTSYSPWDSYVENSAAISAFGLIEGTKVFETIYPHRVGTVTSFISAGATQAAFSDSAIGFDPYEIESVTVTGGVSKPVYKYIIPGLTPKVSFLTGNLAGYNFELSAFYPGTNVFYLNRFKDERGLEFPSSEPGSAFLIQPGDTYTLIDMRLPDEYVTASEEKLLAAGTAYLSENSSPKLDYTLVLDELYLQDKAGDTGPARLAEPPNFFDVGDSIRLVDTELNIDKNARVLGFTRDVIRPYRYTLTLGDAPKVSLVERILYQQVAIKRQAEAAPTVNQVSAQVKETVSTQVGIFRPTIKHTLTGIILPSGLTPLSPNAGPKRHELIAGVIQTIAAPNGGSYVQRKVTLIQGIAKTLFSTPR